MKFGCLLSFFRCFVVNINSYNMDKNGKPLDMVILEKSYCPLNLRGTLIRLLKNKIILQFIIVCLNGILPGMFTCGQRAMNN